MRRYSPPRRGYGGRPRSPPRRAYGGERERGRPKEQNHGSLLVRNIPLNCRPEELRVPFERYGVVRDVYLPKNYYTGGEPRGFAFVQFVDAYDAVEAQHHMNGRMFAGREISVVLASESRKRPEEMRRRTSVRGPSRHEGRRTYHGRSRSLSRSRSPRRLQDTKSRPRSRSYSPAPKRQRDYSPSPVRRQPRSPRGSPLDHDHARRSYSPGYDVAADQNVDRRSPQNYDKRRAHNRSSPGGASRSPPGSRSRSADISPPLE